MTKTLPRWMPAVLMTVGAMTLAACGDDIDAFNAPEGGDNTARVSPLPPTAQCASPLPAEVRNQTVTSPVASDLDPTA